MPVSVSLNHTEKARQTSDANVSLCFGISDTCLNTELFPSISRFSESTFDRSGFWALGSARIKGLTNDAKDAQDVGGEDDQHVDESQENDGYGNVSDPVEGLIRKHHLLNGSPYL